MRESFCIRENPLQCCMQLPSTCISYPSHTEETNISGNSKILFPMAPVGQGILMGK